MKTINMVLMSVMVMALTACGGGGGGGGGGAPGPGTPSGGSATFSGATAGSSSSQCVKDGAEATLAYTTVGSCTASGGAWLSANVNKPDRCRIGGVDFELIGGGSASGTDQLACTDAGGTFLAAETVSQDYCSGGTAPTCAQVGGTIVNVDSVSGNLSSVSLVAGSNTITGVAGATELSCTLNGVNGCMGLSATEYPVYFSVHSEIKDGFGNAFWEATISKATGPVFSGYFAYSSDTPSFSVTLPIATSSKVTVDTATLFYSR